MAWLPTIPHNWYVFPVPRDGQVRGDQVAAPVGHHDEARHRGSRRGMEVDQLPAGRGQGVGHRCRAAWPPAPAGSRRCCRPGPGRSRARRPRQLRPTAAAASEISAARRRRRVPAGRRTEGRRGRAAGAGCPSSASGPSRGMGGGSSSLGALGQPAGDAATTVPRAAARRSCPARPPPRAGRRARHGSADTSSRCASSSVQLGAVDGIERVGAEQFAGFFVGHHASTPRTPASFSTARMRRMPLRMRLFTVPSGCSSIVATSR